MGVRYTLLAVVLVAASIAGAQPPEPIASSEGPVSSEGPDTSYVEFLFEDDGIAYVRCGLDAQPNDSFACERLGPLIEGRQPIWTFETSGTTPRTPGDTLTLLRFVLPQRAARVLLWTDADNWDPLELSTPLAWATAALHHRSLFKRYGATEPLPDLAVMSYWQHHDLFVVIDTTQRFGDGAQVNAMTVKSSLERYFWYRRDVPEYSWQYCIAGVENYRRGHVGHMVGLIPRSRDTLQFNLVRPNYSLPSRLAALETAIVRWQVEGHDAPVTATSGYYGLRSADTCFGRSPQGGAVIRSEEARVFERAATVDSLSSGQRHNVLEIQVPVPRLLVLRGRAHLDRSILTFLDHAVDRRAMARESYGTAGRLPVLGFPMAAESAADINLGGLDLPRNQSTDTWKIDLDAAQSARSMIRGRPRLRIGYDERWASAARYLVNALKAWTFSAELVGPDEPFDLRIEEWDYQSFQVDAQIESVLHHTGASPDDTLLARLHAARTNATFRRTADYASLLARLAESPAYVALCQPVASVRIRSAGPIEFDRDAVGRPLGPILNRVDQR